MENCLQVDANGRLKLVVPRGSHPVKHGILLVDKPLGVTSHDVVAAVRRLAANKKVGHSGTLDPAASGLLIIGIGNGTKLLRYLSGAGKTYQAGIRLGITTDSEDATGLITGVSVGCEELSQPQILAAMEKLTGQIIQKPSALSALKIEGKRAYELVRAGEQVELAARPVEVESFQLLAMSKTQLERMPSVGERPTNEPVISQQTTSARPENAPLTVCDLATVAAVSSGTYIRALARDLGDILGVGAHLTALRRLEVGEFSVDDAFTPDELASRVLQAAPLPVHWLEDICSRVFPVALLDQMQAQNLICGRPVALTLSANELSKIEQLAEEELPAGCDESMHASRRGLVAAYAQPGAAGVAGLAGAGAVGDFAAAPSFVDAASSDPSTCSSSCATGRLLGLVRAEKIAARTLARPVLGLFNN